MNISRSAAKTATFLALTTLFSAICYAMVIGPEPREIFALGLMLSPGLAALLTQAAFERRVGGLGWQLGPLKTLAAGYWLPLAYGLAVYALAWLSGAGRFSPQALADSAGYQPSVPGQAPGLFLIGYALRTATLGVAVSCLSAFGEELGWRGLLVPELAKRYSFGATALISGGIWALWHYPAVLFFEYNNAGAPRWFGMICFTILVIGVSFPLAWLRLRSGSVWPAVLFHACHNVFIQTLFTPLTAPTELSPYVIDEFGVGLALAGLGLGWWFWRKQRALPAAQLPSGSSAARISAG
ncbi:MAG TPA: CPBP family intramembrane glutamic endopeptidase [Herpetosiphonaceae bacterium]